MGSFKSCLALIVILVALPSVARAGGSDASDATVRQPSVTDTTSTSPQTVDVAPSVPVPASETVAATDQESALSADVDAKLRDMDAEVKASRAEIDGLKKSDAAKGSRISALKDRVTSIEEDRKYHTGGIGIGLSVPIGGGGGTAFEITGNLKWLSGYYYVTKGGGLAFNMPITIGRVTIRPLGLGFMYYQDSADTFSSRWLQRSVDLVLPVGIDVRLWRGVQATLQASWFLPNPVDTASAASDSGKAGAQQLDPNFASKAGDVIGNAYGDALKTPRIEIIAKWAF